MLIEREG